MNANADQLQQIVALFSEEVHQVIIFLPERAIADEVAAGLGWRDTLQSLGKECRLVSPVQPECKPEDIPGVDGVTQELGGDNLVISFPHTVEQVNQVGYHVGEQTGLGYVTIRPQVGKKPLAIQDVELSYAGASADVVLFIGVHEITQLEPFATVYADLFRNVPSLSLVGSGASEVGSVKLECDGAASLSEESTHLFMQLGWDVPAGAATALLRGIELSTDWLGSMTTTAATFEAVAALLRAGAARLRKPRPLAPTQPQLTPFITPRSTAKPINAQVSTTKAPTYGSTNPDVESSGDTSQSPWSPARDFSVSEDFDRGAFADKSETLNTDSLTSDDETLTPELTSTQGALLTSPQESSRPYSLAEAMNKRQQEWGIESSSSKPAKPAVNQHSAVKSNSPSTKTISLFSLIDCQCSAYPYSN